MPGSSPLTLNPLLHIEASSPSISVLSLSPFPCFFSWPLSGQNSVQELGNRYLSIVHGKVQLATVVEEPKLLAKQAGDEVGSRILPLDKADQSSAQCCTQVWSPVISQQL